MRSARLDRHARAGAALILGLALAGQTPDDAGSDQREFSVSAARYAFDPARLVVDQDDLVKIAFTAADIPHSFTMDEYRISKRAASGQTVVFEFRADRPGTFRFYCNLANDERCREMRGELVVQSR